MCWQIDSIKYVLLFQLEGILLKARGPRKGDIVFVESEASDFILYPIQYMKSR